MAFVRRSALLVGAAAALDMRLFEDLSQVMSSSTHERKSRTFALEASLMDLAKRVVYDKEEVTNVTTEALDQVTSTMDLVIQGTATESSEDQAEVNMARDAIAKCATDAETHFTKASGINSLANQSATLKAEHASCRESEADLKTAHTQECTELTTYAADLVPPACAGSGWPTVRPSAETLECIRVILDWSANAKVEYPKTERECNASTEEHSTGKATCDDKQAQLESVYCTYAQVLNDTCSDQDSCRAAKIAAQSTTHAAVQVAEGGRKAEYEAAKRVVCLVDVIKSSETEQPTKLQTCIDKSYDTSHLDIDYPGVPAAATCDTAPAAAVPGSTAWETSYTSASWYAAAPTEAVVPCAGTEHA